MDLRSLSYMELENEIIALNEPKYRAGQIFEWLHKRGVREFDAMSNISKALRSRLKEEYELCALSIVKKQVSRDGTVKYLLELKDKNLIEAVLMKYEHGLSLCISSQAGCRMGCKFCASGIDGLSRPLSTGELLDEVYIIQNDANIRISNIVLMGTGEPLDNFDNVIKFIGIISDERGLNISQRSITLSTCGLVPEIRRLADLRLQITLAISLHAVSDDKRKMLMPIANKYPLSELFSACEYYLKKTGRRISLEYALIEGVNDSSKDSTALIGIAKRLGAHINLINANPVIERGFKAPSKAAALAFKNKLEKNGINVTLRRELGRDIDGACGQLRKRTASESVL